MDRVTHTTDDTFRTDVLEANVAVIVDFWAPWCRPCLVIAPWMEDLASELGETAKVVKANVEVNAKAVAAHGIIGLPTVLVFKDGQVVSRQSITARRDDLRSWICNAVGIKAPERNTEPQEGLL